MPILIGRGSEQDRAALHLWTMGNRSYIANERPDDEKAPEALQAALKLVQGISPTAKCRSLTAMYNCVGMVFASRRTFVDSDHLDTILRDDGYRQIPKDEADQGDLVVYRQDRVAKHVGIIYEFRDVAIDPVHPRKEVWVLSQWGENGEYLHKIDEVSPLYGNKKEFWTERRTAR
jgi:hypothetical protein